MKTMIAMMMGLSLWTLPSAEAGEKGNGGDIYAQEYFATAQRLHQAVCVTTTVGSGRLDCELFRKKLNDPKEHVRILSAKVVFGPDKLERDAINDPGANLITISRTRWGEVPTGKAKAGNVMHEFAAIMHLEGSDEYSVSNAIIEGLQAAKVDLEQIGQSFQMNTSDIDAFNEGREAIVCDTGAKDEFGKPIIFRVGHQKEFLNWSWSVRSSVDVASPLPGKRDVPLWINPDSSGTNQMSYAYDIEKGSVVFSYSSSTNQRNQGNDGGWSDMFGLHYVADLKLISEDDETYELLFRIKANRRLRFTRFIEDSIQQWVKAGVAHQSSNADLTVDLKNCAYGL